MPCFSCFIFHFHQIASLSTVLRNDNNGDDEDDYLEACVGVVGSLVLLCDERFPAGGGHFIELDCFYQCSVPLDCKGVCTDS